MSISFLSRRGFCFLLGLLLLPALPADLIGGKVKKLSNGLRYVIIEDHSAPIVSLQVWVRCGAVNENERTAGISHFLEHMVFKGAAGLSAGEIAQVVESRGGRINASTGLELTNYYIDIPSDSFEEAFSVLADSVLYPTFPPDEFEKERLVILEEIKRRHDKPQTHLWDNFMKVMYQNTPYHQVVAGSAETITAMKRETMVDQHKKFYVPSNMVVVLVGDLKASQAKKLIKQKFLGPQLKGAPPAFPFLGEPSHRQGEVITIKRPAQQAHVALGFIGPTLHSEDQVAMDVLSVALGGSRSSPLVQTYREHKQSVWGISSSFMTRRGSGLFTIIAQCPPEKARSLPNELYLTLYQLDSNGFSQRDLDRAKAQLKSSWLFSQESYSGLADQWGFYTTLGHPDLPKTYLKQLEKVSLQDLKRLMGRYFRNNQLSGVILLPEKKQP